MFGKTGVFCDGVMLGRVTSNTLYLRVDDESRATFEEARSSPPLNYAKGGTLWRVPNQVFDDHDEFLNWAGPRCPQPGALPVNGAGLLSLAGLGVSHVIASWEGFDTQCPLIQGVCLRPDGPLP
jgi:hypothetical protein